MIKFENQNKVPYVDRNIEYNIFQNSNGDLLQLSDHDSLW